MARRIAALVLVCLLAAGWWILRGDPDVRAIRKAFGELVDAAQLEQREDLVRAGFAARRIAGYFTDDAQITVPGWSGRIRGRTDIQTAVLRARTMVDRIDISIGETLIEVSEDRTQAELVASASVTAEGRGRTGEEFRAVRVEWSRTDDGWKVSGISPYETIRRGAAEAP